MKIPIPDPLALQRSEALSTQIRDAILMQGGAISFADFMQQALYTPELGYYTANSAKFGVHGDFITAPYVSPLFAQCIAQTCQSVLTSVKESNILEIGAGSGLFAKDFLKTLATLNVLPHHYFILEKSSFLREQQQAFLAETCPDFFARIIWLDALPEKDFSGIIFANEVLDAFPVHCFQIQDDSPYERCVTWKNNQFAWCMQTLTNTALKKQLAHLQQDIVFPSNYISEINLGIAPWITQLANTLKQGIILLFDYGYGRADYYHPDRTQGTLMCFYQHHRHDNPFASVGLQDMTAHVDFTAVVETAVDVELELAGYTTQAAFLFNSGLEKLANQMGLSAVEEFRQRQAIKTLTLPTEMGELVKVMGLTKALDVSLQGFANHDIRHRL